MPSSAFASSSANASGATGSASRAPSSKKKKGRIKHRDILIFTKKLSTMAAAGLPVMRTLRMLENQAENAAMKDIIGQIYKDVESGATLSEAFEKHPSAFDVVYVNLMRAGEASGRLTTFLNRLIVQIEKSEKIRAKVKKALMYPVILLCVAFAVIMVMMIKVVPVFANMFGAMGAELPAPTQFLINASDFVRNPSQGGLAFALVAGACWATRRVIKTNKNAKRKCDALMLRLPVLSMVLRHSVLAKVAMIQGNLSSAGVSVMESLDIIRRTMKNALYDEALARVRSGVAVGAPLSDLYAAEGELFPPAFCQMLAVGEETGNVDEMLESTAFYFEEEFDMSVDRMTELLEPIMIVAMGLTVGFIIVAMYMPIFQMGKVMGG
ncbi:MAG: type II secretion system F family protein [Rickettsiales bacterium]